MFLMQTNESVPQAEIGAYVQRCLENGGNLIVVTKNPDGKTCTVSVQQG